MITWNDYAPGDYRTTCTLCSKTPRDKPLGITILSGDHGIAHCFRCGYVETRQEQREMTPAEKTAFQRRMDALRRQHDAEQRKRQADAAAAAVIRWAAAQKVVDHPYLRVKGIQAHGIRIEADHTLLIPMRDTDGRLHSLQAIAPDGSKRFMPGGRVRGCYCAIGKPSGRLVVCEGYATGATIHEDTGHAVAVAFNSGNLLAVAKALRGKYPCVTLVVAADDDWRTDGKLWGLGLLGTKVNDVSVFRDGGIGIFLLPGLLLRFAICFAHRFPFQLRIAAVPRPTRPHARS